MRQDPRLGWIPDKPDTRDYIYPYKLRETALPVQLDLSQVYNVPVVNQGDLGSCTGNGIASAIAYLQEKEGAAMRYPSRLFIYYNERVIEGTVNDDAGAEIRDGIKSVVSQGYCSEIDWPYDISRFTVKPDALSYLDASRDLVRTYQKVPVDANSIMTALASGYPVIVGFTVYNSFYNQS
ncbi:MAG TPA: C1 family peptidase, partial [Methylomirabilota bacterium]|nr:C1 family peptidase [Methylomirabilota bacterium]